MAYVINKDKGKGGEEHATLIKNETEYRALRNQAEQLRILSAVREGDEKKKKRLLSIMYQGHPNDDSTIKGSDRLSRYFVIDIDERDEADRVIPMIMADIEKYQPAMIERSARYGAHIIFPRPWGKTILEAQCEMALLLHTEIDTNNKNSNRKLYTTSADEADLIYLNPDLFADHFNADEWARESAEIVARKPDLPDMPVKADKHYKVWEHNWTSHGVYVNQSESTPSATETANSELSTPADSAEQASRIYPTEYDGVLYSSIIASYFKLHNGGKEPAEGNRNSLTFQLAVDLAPICNYNQQWLEQIIPCYDGFPIPEWRQTIAQALKEEQKGIRYRTRKAIEDAKKVGQFSKVTGGTFDTPPTMPKRLIQFHKTLLSRTPKLYYPTVAEGAWQALATHLHGVKFRYIDGKLHAPYSFGLLIAPMSTGKGCINEPIEHILKDITDCDAINRRKEAEYKRLNPTGSKKKPRPSDICIQVLMTDVTHAAFILRLKDANANGEKPIYMHVDEVEMLDQIKGNTKGSSVFAYIKLAYDCAPIGQERVGAESIDGNAPLRWNCNASTTPAMARKYFRNAVYDGTLSRMNLNTVLVPDDNTDIPVFGEYNEAYTEELKPYIDRLNAASGEIFCPQAAKLARQLDKENKARAIEYDSKVYEKLSYRANINAYVKGMILYILNDYKWCKDIEQYVRWSEQWDLWCKLRYFYDYMEADIKAEENAINQGPCNLIASLPQEFSYQQFLEHRHRVGKTGDGKAVLRKWQSRGYVEYNDNDKIYVKVGKYAKQNNIKV